MKSQVRGNCSAPAWLVLLVLMTCSLGFGQDRAPSKNLVPKSEDRDKLMKREQWFLRGRTAPLGQSAAELRYRAYQQKMKMRKQRPQQFAAQTASSTPPFSSNVWNPLGPAPELSDATTSYHSGGDLDYGPVSGRATSVVIDPNDPTGNTVYVGGAYGGLWKSTNAASGSPGDPSGVTWTALLDNQPTLAVGAIAVQPGNGNVIIVGTGESNNSGDSYYGLGILRSADGGQTWTLIAAADTGAHPFKGLAFSKIAFSTANPNLVVAAVAGSVVGFQDGAASDTAVRGLYYSTDAGQTWSLATETDGTATVQAGSATSVVYNAANNQFYAAIRYHGYYTSTDGAHWTRLPNQPISLLNPKNCPANPFSSVCPIFRSELAVTPGRNEIYVWFIDFNWIDQGIYKSLDGGNTWTQLNNGGIWADGEPGSGTTQGGYNLELAPVPNGTGTDLYAGAVNIYKCSINDANPTCDNQPFIDLTHVYGCGPIGSLSHVHPDQHGVAFRVVNGQAIMYFANDGGIYRALDGFTGLTSANCWDPPNQFDSLNGTLGSMTQFVSFSQDPTDPNTILGGTQDNGSPATGTAESGGPWMNVNVGDGGYNAINPDNPSQWFTTYEDVTIQRCDNGINCLAQDFPFIVTPDTLEGDHGSFYTPYILDPQNSNFLIVGTCRVWRGVTDGSGFRELSQNFDTGAIENAGRCWGSESNMVRSLAAGGPTDENGSLVIYAGTDGPSSSSVPSGRVFVTTNAAIAPAIWKDVTASINPRGYPISSIAVDASDVTGKTAYVTVMGFGVSHVWKTGDAGNTWTDFTANLPDSPANSLVLDSSSGVVYVGTDVGVFESGTGSPFWVEVGPISGGGFLPSVPVTALRIFNSGGQKILRASTYGRGVWEAALTTLDFSITSNTNSQTVKAGASATYNLDLTPLGGALLSSVTFSCSGLPALTTCSFNPTQVAAGTSSATSLTVAISTTSPTVAVLRAPEGHAPRGLLYAMVLPLSGMVLVFGGMVSGEKRRKRVAIWTVLGLILLLMILQVACGSGSTPPPPPPAPRPGTAPGTYTVTVNATSGSLSHSTTVTLVVQ